MFSRKVSKGETPDKSEFVYHDPHGDDQMKRDWSQVTQLTVISIDPGLVNLGYRLVRRPYKAPVLQVEVLNFSNTNYKSYKTDPETGVSTLYRKINEYFDQYKEIYPEVHIVIIEGQLPFKYNTVRVFQHIVSYYVDRMAHLPLYPLVIEINPSLKTKILQSPKGLNESQIKDWSVEKALQLSFLRQDWLSFETIVNSTKYKADDLSDTIIQLEALCKKFGWGITPIPSEWSKLPPFTAWQPGSLFFRHLFKLLNYTNLNSCSTKGWLSVLKKHLSNIKLIRESMVLNGETGQLTFVSKILPLKLNFQSNKPKLCLRLNSLSIGGNNNSLTNTNNHHSNNSLTSNVIKPNNSTEIKLNIQPHSNSSNKAQLRIKGLIKPEAFKQNGRQTKISISQRNWINIPDFCEDSDEDESSEEDEFPDEFPDELSDDDISVID